MIERFDAIIAGLGAMGSAAAYHLAQRRAKVLGLDRLRPPHTLGSSHGKSRIIREAYFEDPTYVPLVQRAYELWFELQTQAATPLFLETGGLMLGPSEGVVFSGAKRSAEMHNLPHEILSAKEVRRRFPALRPHDEMSAVWEPRAGILTPEGCIEAHLKLARQSGSELRLEEPVIRWAPESDGVRVITSRGEYFADTLILTVGSWLADLLPDLNLRLKVERQVLFWFDPARNNAQFSPQICPIHLWEHSTGKFFYGFPDTGEGVKVARHHEGEITSPEAVRRETSADEVTSMRSLLRDFLPDADGALRSSTVCLYTNTPDGHFLINRHPEYPQVILASPCSGHGFKFSSAIGEALADLSQNKAPKCNLSLFRLRWSGFQN